METFTHLIVNLFLCTIGLIGYSLFSVRKYLHPNVFKWSVFLNHNKIFWIWAGTCQLLYALLMAFYPLLEQILAERILASMDALFNIKLGIPKELATTVVYLSLTWQLSRIANKSVKNKDKIGNQKT